jgi:hypothetical protein
MVSDEEGRLRFEVVVRPTTRSGFSSRGLTIAGEPIEVSLYTMDNRAKIETDDNVEMEIMESDRQVRIRICWSTGQETTI